MAKSPIEVILVFDLETTGLSEEKHCITEIACCPISLRLEDLPEYTSGIIKPYGDREINQGALDVTGITREQLENGRDSKEVCNEVYKYIKSLHKTANKIVLAGHNIDSFDIPFLDIFFTYHKKDLSKLVNEKITIDTMWWARVKWEDSVNYKLGTCCQNENITLVDGHRALNDTRSNRELVKRFIKSLRGDGVLVKQEERPRIKFEF